MGGRSHWWLRLRASALSLRLSSPRWRCYSCHPLIHLLLHLILLTLLLLSHLPSPFSSAPPYASLSAQLSDLHSLHDESLSTLTALRSNLHTLHYLLAQHYSSTDNPALLAHLAGNSSSCPSPSPSPSFPPSPYTSTWSEARADALFPSDLSHPSRASDPLHTSAPSYDYCAAPSPPPLPYCEETPTSEQYFQLTFFDRPGAGRRVTPREGRPKHTTCVQLPPLDYRFPNKSAPLPCPPDATDCVHLPNLRVRALEQLTIFNEATPKNLYHFESFYYDREQELLVRLASQYIPFGPKVRLMLDIGAGGGSIGLLLHRRYSVQTLSTAFADWPYCEFMSERGGLCVYLDAMEPMPFAKFSFDVVHSGWVFHACTVPQVVQSVLEQHRILRPGGYLWIHGGWSHEQVAAMEQLLVRQLGYATLYDSRVAHDESDGWKFDETPFQLEWHCILQRPLHAHCGDRARAVTGGTGA